MHPILAEWRRLFAYLGAWAIVGVLIAGQLVLAAPFGWLEALVFAVPLSLFFGFLGLGAFWVCKAAPLALPRLARSLATQLIASLLSAALWLAVGRGWATALDRLGTVPGLPARLPQAAALLLGLGGVLFLLTAALHYLLGAFTASQDAERRALEFEVASREAELRALRAQIHPHFLFNSLNSINALIAARPEEARRLCVGLADFLRRSLTVGSRESIPLAEELDLAEQLFAIERVRFGERLVHEVRADAVRLLAERRGEALHVSIENPRDPEAPGRRGTGIGLQNVRRRLAALHGDRAELRVVSSAETFRVELRFPAGR
jgi:hypothetical protein